MRLQTFRKLSAFFSCVIGLLILYATLVGIRVVSTIDPSVIEEIQASNEINDFTIRLWDWSMVMRSDGMETPMASKLQLFEDGLLIGPAHSIHADIAALGGGRYSHWHGRVIFSSTDNSDPRVNGHIYSYTGILQLPILFIIVSVFFIAVAFWFWRETIVSVIRNPRFEFRLPLVISTSIILCAISLLWLSHLFIFARNDIAQNEIVIITGFSLIVLAIQTLILIVFRKFIAPLFVIITVFNTYSLYFVFSGEITTYPIFTQLLLIFGIGALYFVLYKFILGLSGHRGWIVVGMVFSVVIVGLVGVGQIAVGTGFTKSSATDFLGVRMVDFTRHPNVYFLGFDGLMPAPLTAKLLQVEDPQYIEIIKQHDGHIIPNLFADQVPTTQFWARTMNIMPISKLAQEIILGIQPAPVLATFRYNGYDTHLSFWSSFFGPNKGPYLTSYDTYEPYSTCSFLDDLPKHYGLFGYCVLLELNLPFFKQRIRSRYENLIEFYLDRLSTITRDNSSTPHLFISHFPYPGHTALRYQRTAKELQEYRETYRNNSTEAANILDKMLTEIQTSDPAAIVFLFGDHGSYVSRGLSYRDDPNFVVQDRHGIMGAVFGDKACMPFLQPQEGESIKTSSQVVAGLIQCLADGENPLTRVHDFTLINQAPENMRFEEHAYE